MGGGTRIERIKIALNFFPSFTHHRKYCWPSNYYHLLSILLANIVGTPSKLPMYKGGSLNILYERQQSWEHTEKQSTGFESGEVHVSAASLSFRLLLFAHRSESFIHQRKKGSEPLLRTHLGVGYSRKQ